MLAERERLLLSREEAAKDKDNVIYQKDEILRHKNEKIAEHETTLAKLTLKVSFSGDENLWVTHCPVFSHKCHLLNLKEI